MRFTYLGKYVNLITHFALMCYCFSFLVCYSVTVLKTNKCALYHALFQIGVVFLPGCVCGDISCFETFSCFTPVGGKYARCILDITMSMWFFLQL